MLKAYKSRIYPNIQQKIFLYKCFGCSRFIYNQMLHDQIEYYKEHKEMLQTNPASSKKEFEFLKEVDSLACKSAYINLNISYKNFFKKTEIRFPKFKSWMRIKQHRLLDGLMKSCTLSKNSFQSILHFYVHRK